MTLEARIKRAEGYSETPYRCPAGKFTVGHGINVQGMPIPPRAVTVGDLLDWLCDPENHEQWFRQRLTWAQQDAERYIGSETWEGLSETRRGVLVELAYWLGYPKLLGFVDFRAAVQAGLWVRAEAALLDSLLARQVPGRTGVLASLMLEG